MSMTDQEKLQKLFDAALRDCSPIEKAPTRAVPQPAASLQAVPMPEEKPAPVAAAPMTEVLEPALQTITPVELDKQDAEELGALLDEQVARRNRKHRIESMVAAVVLIGLTGGSAGWFVQSPERVQAFLSVIAEIRSVGDVKGMVAKYEAALKRISARGQQIDQASSAMGVKPGAEDEKDAYFDAEMKQMMGGEGRTVGARVGNMERSFGDIREKHGISHDHVANADGVEDSIGLGH
jgi:hypothetical protein